MAPVSGCRPAQLKIAVDDVDAAIVVYRRAFGFRDDVTRRTREGEYSSFVFSKYGDDGFFLLHLRADPQDPDHPSRPTTFGLLVDDLGEARQCACGWGDRDDGPSRRGGNASVFGR